MPKPMTKARAWNPARTQVSRQVSVDTLCAKSAYGEWIAVLKTKVRNAQLRAAVSVNVELIRLYWDIGNDILSKQREEGWGAKIVERIATDLRAEFPSMTGFSRANLMYMRSFAAAWTKEQIVQQPVGQIPWGHNVVILDKVKDPAERMIYAELTVKNGWSRNVLVHQIELGAARRHGKALTNFKATLPEVDSDLAEQTLKSSYNLSFLGADEKIKENRLRAMLVDKVAAFLLELGAGFAYVGKAVPINVGGDDFEMDLLFYQLQLHRYFVIELKTRKFKPADVGQLGFYMTAVDRQVKAPSDGKTIGLLLCKSRNKVVVEYSLSDCEKPIGVSTYDLKLPEGLPSPKVLEEKLTAVLMEDCQ